jgi:hypothetical protein
VKEGGKGQSVISALLTHFTRDFQQILQEGKVEKLRRFRRGDEGGGGGGGKEGGGEELQLILSLDTRIYGKSFF